MSQKIESLTEEQKARMPEYVNKWISKGINTGRLDPVKTKEIIDGYRSIINMPVDVPMMIVENPLEAWVMCNLFLNFNIPLDQLHAEMTEVFNGNPKKYEIPKAQLPWQSGSLFSSVFSFYDYVLSELPIEIDPEILRKYRIWEQTAELGPIYPLDNLTVVSQKPLTIHLNANNVLHKDGGPALEYSGMGNLKVYSLNGVRVPEYVAVTPEEQIDLDYYNQITNADVKAEFVRKVGIERFKEKGLILDSYKNYPKETHPFWHKSEYEVWEMESMFEGLSSAPFLSMVNQTTSIFHFEGVSPSCKTVGDAVKERFGGRNMQIVAIA